jgi:hypothetical protein
MSYRTPIVVGDRVALAPHTDLWMAGCRYGTVTSIGGEGMVSGRFYFIDLDTGRNVTLRESDLLGAVAGTPVGGASPSTDQPRHAYTYTDALDGENRSRAACIAPKGSGLRHTACPRHTPAYWAEYMARHATDSIVPVDRDPWSGRS